MLFDTLGIDAVWSNGGTQLTVPLPSPLPAGLPIVVVFDSFVDLAGNVQTGGIDYRVDVAGTPDPWPFVDNNMSQWWENWTEAPIGGPMTFGNDLFFLRYEGQSDGTFRVARYEDSSFSTLFGYDIYRPLADRVELSGMAEVDLGVLTTTTITPAAIYQKLPFQAQSWSGTATLSDPTMTANVSYTVTVIGQEDLVDPPAKTATSLTPVWTDAWKTALDYRLTDPSTGQIVISGTDSLWFAPTVGLVRMKSHESGPDGSRDSAQYFIGLIPATARDR